MGIIYFLVIVIANSIGAISGMGGGVLIKPVLDFIGYDSVTSVSFYSTVAVFTMSIVSTIRQLSIGSKVNIKIVLGISIGAVGGGIFGNICFEAFLSMFDNDKIVQLIQIIITIFTLLFAFLYSKYEWRQYRFNILFVYMFCGFVLGYLSSFLGIGGGPINVSLLMMLFSFPIKEATVYSIATIFFSQLAKLVTIGTSAGFERYDLTMLYFVIPAAVVGGLVGANISHFLSEEKVTTVFQTVIVVVIFINIYNGFQIFI